MLTLYYIDFNSMLYTCMLMYAKYGRQRLSKNIRT